MSGISKAAHYRSWYETAKKIKDPLERVAFYDALDAYRFDGIEPDGLSELVDILWTAVKPSVDADINRRKSGAKGGAPKNNANARKFREKTAVVLDGEDGSRNGTTGNNHTSETTEGTGEDGSRNGTTGNNHTSETTEGTGEDGSRNGTTENNHSCFVETSNVDDDDDVNDDVDVDVDDDDDGAPVGSLIAEVGQWLSAHSMAYGSRELAFITASLAARGYDSQYLDYSVEYLKSKSYRARDGGGTVTFDDIPEGNRSGLFLKAVTGWKDMEPGFHQWLSKKSRQEELTGTPQPRRPFKCPRCGGALRETPDMSICPECNGYLDWTGEKWRIVGFPEVSLEENFRIRNTV